MPRSAGARFGGAHVVNRSATTFAAPTRDLDDAVLKARTGRRRTDSPFTAEHRAAYAAFVGVTDEPTARGLWRAGVTWDDVDDYCAHGVPAADYRLMRTLAAVDVSPQGLGEWQRVCRAATVLCGGPVSPQAIAEAAKQGLTASVFAAWLREYAPAVHHTSATALLHTVAGHHRTITPAVAVQWADLLNSNSLTLNTVVTLVGLAASPAAVTVAVRANDRSPAVSFAMIKTPEGGAPVANALTIVRPPLPVKVAAQWAHAIRTTGITAQRAALLIYAGANPGDAAAWEQSDDATLAVLGALNGHDAALALADTTAALVPA